MQAHHQAHAVQQSRAREGLDHPLHIQCLQGHPAQRGAYQKRRPRGGGGGSGHLAEGHGGRTPGLVTRAVMKLPPLYREVIYLSLIHI